MSLSRCVLSAVGACLCGAAIAAGTGNGHKHTSQIGMPGSTEEVSRSIEVVMTDNSFDRSNIDIQPGETMRFVVHNRGRLVHEFNIGTPHMHEEHQRDMLEMMQAGVLTPTGMKHGAGMMQHDHTNSALIEPGETKELIWHFQRKVDDLEFACNVPGHYQSGMVGAFHFN